MSWGPPPFFFGGCLGQGSLRNPQPVGQKQERKNASEGFMTSRSRGTGQLLNQSRGFRFKHSAKAVWGILQAAISISENSRLPQRFRATTCRLGGDFEVAQFGPRFGVLLFKLTWLCTHFGLF